MLRCVDQPASRDAFVLLYGIVQCTALSFVFPFYNATNQTVTRSTLEH